MGMGEPLANLDALLEALAVATSPPRRARHRCPARHDFDGGLAGQDPPAWPSWASSITWPCRCTLPTTPCATQIVPTNDKTGLAAILEAADYFYANDGPASDVRVCAAGRDVNDAPAHAPRAGPVAARPAGPRQPDPVQRRRGLALPPAHAEQSLSDFLAGLASSTGSASRCANAKGPTSTRPAASFGVRRCAQSSNRMPVTGTVAAWRCYVGSTGDSAQDEPYVPQAATGDDNRGNDRRDQRPTGPARSGHPPHAAGPGR